MESVAREGSRTPAEASSFSFDLQQRRASCVTDRVLSGRAYHALAGPNILSFGPNPVPIGRRSDLAMVIRLGYHLAESAVPVKAWHVMTDSYVYQVLNRRGTDVVAYRWHPSGLRPIAYPHLHVGGSTAPVDLSKTYLPTGSVGLHQVIRMAITELQVEPLRSDWESILTDAAAMTSEVVEPRR